MQNHFFSNLQILLQKGFPLALSFADDALLLLAARVGLQLPWLQWLSTLLLAATILYWLLRLVKGLYLKYALTKPGVKPRA